MHFRLKIAVMCCVLLLGSSFASAATKRRKPVQPPPPPPVQEAPPAPPQPPPTPEQMPAVPPHVSMNNGMLTISAENSTMGDILGAVRKQTGASLDVPPSISSERVATKLGPGVPREVLQQLFAGSKFDYILVGTPQDPYGLQRIILTARSSGGGNSGPAMANNQPAPQPQQDINEMDEEPQPEPQQPEPTPEQQTVTPPTGGQPYSNQPKTPEQLLQELQQMQQQQQQPGGQPDRPPRAPVQQAPPQ